jgi:hypothetical protein
MLQMVDGWSGYATLPKCHEVRRRRCARIQRKRYCAEGETTCLDPASLAAKTRLGHSSVADIDDACEREREAMAELGERG